MSERAAKVSVVLAGGDPVSCDALGVFADEIDAAELVIAADSGIHLAGSLGLRVDVVVGDMDSATPEAVEAARAAGAIVQTHPAAKDHTDLELALHAADSAGATRVVVLGLAGGRLDHFVANALLLASPDFADLDVEAATGDARVYAIHRSASLRGAPGDLVTLLAVGGPATGVRTTGLEFPLVGDTLLPGSSRGVSNVMTEAMAVVSLESGTILAIQPGPEER